jgi:hypothetical protein
MNAKHWLAGLRRTPFDRRQRSRLGHQVGTGGIGSLAKKSSGSDIPPIDLSLCFLKTAR